MRIIKKVFPVLLALVLIFSGTALAEKVNITILHTNDSHGRINFGDDSGKSIGFAEIAAVAKKMKAENPATLLVTAGDVLQGLPVVNINKGQDVGPILDAAGYDLMVPGNHDFDFGYKNLLEVAGKMACPVISANVRYKDTKENLFLPYKEFNLSGVKVAVIGLTTPESANSVRKSAIADIEFVKPVKMTRKLVKQLRKNNDVIICVMHMGVIETLDLTSIDIAGQVPGIDVIIDGHSHTELPEGIVVDDTLICQTGCHTHNLGQVDITVEDGKVTGKKARLLDKDAVKAIAPEEDAATAEVVQETNDKSRQLLNKKVATFGEDLTGYNFYVRAHESKLGNLIADSFRYAAKTDIAMVNGGGIRTDFHGGDVTYGDVYAVMPFGNIVKKYEIKGSVVKKVLEHSVEYYPQPAGAFASFSGLTFTFDAAKPAGSRVSEIKIGGKNLEMNRKYTLAVTDFLVEGGDKYFMLKGIKHLSDIGTDSDVLIEYLNSGKIADYSLGRVTMLNGQPVPAGVGD